MIGYAENYTEKSSEMRFTMNAFMANYERSRGTSFSPETIASENKKTAAAVSAYRAERAKRAARKVS